MNTNLTPLIVFVLLFSFSCQDFGFWEKDKDLEASTTFYYVGTQCADPWAQGDSCSKTFQHEEDRGDRVAEWLECQGLEVEELEYSLCKDKAAVCQACVCHSGELYEAELAYVTIAQRRQLEEWGFTKEKPQFDCDANEPPATTVLYYSATQCADPWMVMQGDDACYSDATDAQYLKRMEDYLTCQELTVEKAELHSEFNGMFCEACYCPDGRVYAVEFPQLSEDDIGRLSALGFDDEPQTFE